MFIQSNRKGVWETISHSKAGHGLQVPVGGLGFPGLTCLLRHGEVM